MSVPNHVMNGVKMFCQTRLNEEENLQEYSQSIHNLMNKKRMHQDQLKDFMEQKGVDKFQVLVDGVSLQAYKKQIHTYELPTLNMLMTLNMDWKKFLTSTVTSNVDVLTEYLFNVVQKSRRTTKISYEVKKTGTRNMKKLPTVTDTSIAKTMASFLHVSENASYIRKKRKRITSSNTDSYKAAMEFMRSKNLNSQTFNLKNEQGQPKKKLLLRRVPVANIRSLSGKNLKTIIHQSIQELLPKLKGSSSTQFVKKAIGEEIMANIHKHQKLSRPQRERLLYEIK